MDALGVYAGYKQSSTIGSSPAILGERLFVIAHPLNESCHGNLVTVGHFVHLTLNSRSIDQLPCISNQSGCGESYVVIYLVHFLNGIYYDQLARYSLVYNQYYSISILEPYSGCPSFDGFPGVLHLIQTSVRRECRNSMVISPSTRLHQSQ